MEHYLILEYKVWVARSLASGNGTKMGTEEETPWEYQWNDGCAYYPESSGGNGDGFAATSQGLSNYTLSV